MAKELKQVFEDVRFFRRAIDQVFFKGKDAKCYDDFQMVGQSVDGHVSVTIWPDFVQEAVKRLAGYGIKATIEEIMDWMPSVNFPVKENDDIVFILRKAMAEKIALDKLREYAYAKQSKQKSR